MNNKLLKIKDENESLNNKIQELMFNNGKDKEEYINVMRVAFEKFMIQTKIDNKNKEFCNIILKLLNYSKTDIEFIYNSIQLKKKGKFI